MVTTRAFTRTNNKKVRMSSCDESVPHVVYEVLEELVKDLIGLELAVHVLRDTTAPWCAMSGSLYSLVWKIKFFHSIPKETICRGNMCIISKYVLHIVIFNVIRPYWRCRNQFLICHHKTSHVWMISDWICSLLRSNHSLPWQGQNWELYCTHNVASWGGRPQMFVGLTLASVLYIHISHPENTHIHA